MATSPLQRQMPLAQSLLQHSASPLQLAPDAAQAPVPVSVSVSVSAVLVSSVPVSVTVSSVLVSSVAVVVSVSSVPVLETLPLHTPPLHDPPLQQSESLWHGSPSSPQAWPPGSGMQRPLEHVASATQLSPTLQSAPISRRPPGGGSHTPFTHESLSHS
jgi:hypothetical protein